MSEIKKVVAREIIDSRGSPTIEVDVHLSNGIFGRAAAPSGASKGVREALEARDEDPNRFHGRGVLKAVTNINTLINSALVGQDPLNQEQIDSILIDLDGTENKSKLGANATTATSIAVLKAAALLQKAPLFKHLNNTACVLPVPLMNIINGGAHANNKLDIQEFMIAPTGAKNIKEAIQIGAEVFFSLREILAKRGFSTSVGDEGGFAPELSSNKEALEMILFAIEKAGYKAGKDVMLALDVAASEFYKDGQYYLMENKEGMYSTEVVTFFEELISNFPIYSIEDGLAQDDYFGWQELTKRLGGRIQLVGDDIFVTNTKIISECIELKIGNSVLIKPNQIGTVTETLNAIKLARKNDYSCIMSHRSGETEDTTIAHFAVGSGCGQIKIGSICRSDRTAKYNELMRIEEFLDKNAEYRNLLKATSVQCCECAA